MCISGKNVVLNTYFKQIFVCFFDLSNFSFIKNVDKSSCLFSFYFEK